MKSARSTDEVCIAGPRVKIAPRAQSGSKTAAAAPAFPEFVDAFRQRWPEELVGVVLFGSAARGDATEGSDIDLLLVMKPGMKIVRGLYHQWEDFCSGYRGAEDSARISPHFVSLPKSVQDAGGLWYETAIDGIVVWERDRCVSRFLASVRRAMRQGKIRRRALHGSHYWLKEF